MSSIVDLKDVCHSKVRRFTRLMRRYEPAVYQPSALVSNRSSWTEEANNALDELVESIEDFCVKHG